MPWIEQCKSCQRPFSILKKGEQDAAAEQQTEIDCPHCNDVWGTHHRSGFQSSPLKPEEEEAYRRGEFRSSGQPLD
jgi:hypothetical protein